MFSNENSYGFSASLWWRVRNVKSFSNLIPAQEVSANKTIWREILLSAALNSLRSRVFIFLSFQSLSSLYSFVQLLVEEVCAYWSLLPSFMTLPVMGSAATTAWPVVLRSTPIQRAGRDESSLRGMLFTLYPWVFDSGAWGLSVRGPYLPDHPACPGNGCPGLD